MIINGKKIAEKIAEKLKKEVSGISKKFRLAIVTVGEDAAMKSFVERKKAFADSIGCKVRIYENPKDISTTALRKRMSKVMHIKANMGVVLQLPLPDNIRTDYMINSILPEKDIDVLTSKAMGDFLLGRSIFTPPVVGAVRHILSEHRITLEGKNITVIGSGRLVGTPIALWLLNEKRTFRVVEKDISNLKNYIKDADIIFSGIGSAGIIKGDMISDGAVVIDAGVSSGEGDKLAGDVDFGGAEKKASLITPVPGGVGPITVAVLFENLIKAVKAKK